ncbi:hypothetical protein Dda_7925 [Drechslerella dactyloides]|uniref:LYR motif-containing protein Cup1-like N-terminal domain-containing protein n=1 Tax=Drechslerella dactyloides TaxID=74499 RepID=A0AAD6IUL5_DREDA|nr:hypothetical protein Dda_7925 [Drechslerella dactyloides]
MAESKPKSDGVIYCQKACTALLERRDDKGLFHKSANNKVIQKFLEEGGLVQLDQNGGVINLLKIQFTGRDTAPITLESFIPARCWMAPLIPTHRYNSGATTLPVCPTCSELSAKPLSTAALLAPTAAPIAFASGISRLSKFSLLFNARPPLTTFVAVSRSGMSDTAACSSTHSTDPTCLESFPSTTSAAPLPAAAALKAVCRTVITFLGSLHWTVAMMLPAYIGRTKVSDDSTAVMSETCCTSSMAARRGMTFLPKMEWTERIWVVSSGAFSATNGAYDSGMACANACLLVRFASDVDDLIHTLNLCSLLGHLLRRLAGYETDDRVSQLFGRRDDILPVSLLEEGKSAREPVVLGLRYGPRDGQRSGSTQRLTASKCAKAVLQWWLDWSSVSRGRGLQRPNSPSQLAPNKCNRKSRVYDALRLTHRMPSLSSLVLRPPTVLSKSQQAISLLRHLYRETSCLFDDVARSQIKKRIRERFRECQKETDEQRRSRLLKDGRRALSTLIRANTGDKWRQVHVLLHAYGQKGRRKHELLKPLIAEAQPEPPLVPALPRTAPPGTSPRLLALIKAQVGKAIKMAEPVIPETTPIGKPFPVIRIANMKWRHRANTLSRISPPLNPSEFESLELIVMGYKETKPPKRSFITRDTKRGPKKQRPNVYTSRKQRRILRYILEQFPTLEAKPSVDDESRWIGYYSPVLTTTLHTEGDAEDFEGVDEKGDPIGLHINPNQRLKGHAASNRKKVVKRATAFSEWLEKRKAEGKIPEQSTPVG